jgi:N-acetylmuramoyl-L-alanine amidase
MPAVLVELGFVTNAEDATLLTSKTDLNKFAEAVYNGLAGFIEKFESSGGFTESGE